MSQPILKSRSTESLLLLLFICVFFILLLRTAWMSDDAYITLRTVDNFVGGHGLTFNIGERVQTYTHPLWMLLMSVFYLFTREAYFTTLFLSIGVSLLAVVLFASRIASSHRLALVGIAGFLMSKAFVDYSTSGLENPLSHLMIVAFFTLYFRPGMGYARVATLSLVAALGALTRLDLLLVFAPPLIQAIAASQVLRIDGVPRAAKAIVFGFSPLLLWLGFSVLYYGFVFPNPAFAKLHTGIDQRALITQGLCYLLNAINVDPLTVVVICAGCVAAIWEGRRQGLAIAGSILLYLLYIVWIGGDFMSGRFLTVPFLCAVIYVCHSCRIEDRFLLLLILGVIAVVGLSSPRAPLHTTEAYGVRAESQFDNKGISDERAYYNPETGLLRTRRNGRWPDNQWVEEAISDRSTGPSVEVRESIGMYGFTVGSAKHVIDPYALADPLLARLPVSEKRSWRVGHYKRAIPDGYIETLASGQNVISDPDLAKFYDVLALITRGRLSDPARLVAIWRMNTRQYDYLINK